eukprot:COSAG06_NODE_9901_length_1793_cov_1.151122_3_plen_377_part_01
MSAERPGRPLKYSRGGYSSRRPQCCSSRWFAGFCPLGVEQAAAAGAAEGAGVGGGAAADAEAGGKDGVAMRSVDDGVALAVCKGPEALAAAEPQASAPGGVEQAPVLGEAEGAGARGTPLRFEWKRPATASVPIGLPGSSEQVATSATCSVRPNGFDRSKRGKLQKTRPGIYFADGGDRVFTEGRRSAEPGTRARRRWRAHPRLRYCTQDTKLTFDNPPVPMMFTNTDDGAAALLAHQLAAIEADGALGESSRAQRVRETKNIIATAREHLTAGEEHGVHEWFAPGVLRSMGRPKAMDTLGTVAGKCIEYAHPPPDDDADDTRAEGVLRALTELALLKEHRTKGRRASKAETPPPPLAQFREPALALAKRMLAADGE